MARMKFLCDAERCIECACVTACKCGVPGKRRRVVLFRTENGERSISVACSIDLMYLVPPFVR